MTIPTNPTPETQTVILERTFPHPPEKLWRALTQSDLLAQWLLANDFEPIPGRSFQLRSEPVPYWDGIIHCQLLVLDPLKSLSYTWSTLGVDTVVLFTLTPTGTGTHLRLEHSGFRPDNPAAYKGATYGWQNFLSKLDTLLTETPQ